MNQQSRLGAAACDGHAQRLAHQLCWHARGHGPAHYFSGEQVQHHRQIEPATACANVGDVAGPCLVGLVRTELALQYVVCNGQAMATVGGVRELAPPARSQPVRGHQGACFVAPNSPALQFQLCTQAATAVAAATGMEDCFGLKAQWAHCSLCGGTLARRVPARAAHAEHPAPLAHCGLLRLCLRTHQVLNHFISRAKKADAFFKSSLSDCNCLT